MAKLLPLPGDATLESVVPTLLKPEDHVRVVLSNMTQCRSENGDALVRIGITGEGKVPYHKVSYLDAAGDEQFYGAFDGKKKVLGVRIHDATWSTQPSTYAEVQKLIGEIRGYKTPKKSS